MQRLNRNSFRLPRPLACFLVVAVVFAPSFPVHSADDNAKTEETWDAVFIGQDKVGYVHTVVRPVKENGKPAVHVKVETVMSIKRFGQSTDMKLDYNSFETPDGKLLRIDNRGLDTVTRGVVQGNVMKLTLNTPGKQSTQAVPWSNDVIGPAAEDRILKKEPLKPGEKRSFRSFMPDLNRIVSNTYYGEGDDDAQLLDGSTRRLQKVRAEIDGIPELKNMKTFLWLDEAGGTLKTTTTMLAGMSTYRVSRDVALVPAGALSADFGEKSLVKVAKQIPKPYDTTEIVYRIELKDENPVEVFPKDERQSLAKNDKGEWLLTIRAIGPTEPAKDSPQGDLAAFLRSNNWLQTENPKVIAAAKEAVGDAKDPWDKARRIERWVHDKLTAKNFSKVFDSAAVVAEKLEGDCTEHGVLLAAMARVAGIPSRVAMGLVYAERLGAFGYHMWAEVYVNGRWIPLDGTLGLGHASPAHVKLGDSSLDGTDAMTTFLPVARVMGALKMDVVSWKHATAE